MHIPFSDSTRKRIHAEIDKVLDSGFLSLGNALDQFEKSFSTITNIPSLGFSSGGSALLALFQKANVSGREVIVPANTFVATPRAARLAGADIIYADCNKDDLCISLDDIQRKTTSNTAAICVVHIGGHIAFEIDKIAQFCEERGIALIEDCAHAHGASFHGQSAGSWGLGGAYSFYATKTLPLGEGGILCSRHPEVIEWASKFRNYGKEVQEGKVLYPLKDGFNYRLSEISAAFGLAQLEELPSILKWKRDLAEKYDRIFDRRIRFPKGMISGYYKYIAFNYALSEQTGQVFAKSDFGPVIDGSEYDLPNSDWSAENHVCPPMWYGWEHAGKSPEELAELLGVKE